MGELIGKGGYGEVYLAEEVLTAKEVAIKVYDKYQMSQANRLKSVNNEIRILKRLDHPNIIKLHSVHETVTHIYLVMEYVKGISLMDFLKEKRRDRYYLSE